MKDKLTKFLVVVCLTLLIWTWAFLSQEDMQTFSGTLQVSPATDRSLLVTFWMNGNELSQHVNLGLTFKGTPAKIQDLSRLTEQETPEDPQRNPLNYYYNPRDFGHVETDFYTFNLFEFLQKQSQIRGLALTLDSCSINQQPVDRIDVQIEVLENKPLPVVCLDETGLTVPGAIAEPAQVDMYVRSTYNQPAYVTLSDQQIELAQLRPVRGQPYVDMGTDRRRRALQEVTVTILKETVALRDRTLSTFEPPRRIGYIFSDNLAGKYTVQMDPDSESQLRTIINLRATDQAWEAYSRLRYPILIEIRDEDIQNISEPITKEIIYNFPKEFVAKKEIEFGEPRPPQTAVIMLIPVTAATETP